MSSKRPTVDLLALTSEEAAPMPEAMQRSAPPVSATVPRQAAPQRRQPAREKGPAEERVTTANLEALAFKVSPSFRKRFRQRAAEVDLKLNELLFAAFDVWEAQQGFKK